MHVHHLEPCQRRLVSAGRRTARISSIQVVAAGRRHHVRRDRQPDATMRRRRQPRTAAASQRSLRRTRCTRCRTAIGHVQSMRLHAYIFTSSTRRFFARPSSVALTDWPKPFASPARQRRLRGGGHRLRAPIRRPAVRRCRCSLRRAAQFRWSRSAARSPRGSALNRAESSPVRS